MKYLPLVLAVLLSACGQESTPAKTEVAELKLDRDGCNINTSSKLVTQHNVGPITNLVKDEFEFGWRNECTVKFDITVNGQTYHLEETETGLEQMGSVCYKARERARKNLLLDLGGTFKSEASIACRHQDRL
jgi:hypothetical protein